MRAGREEKGRKSQNVTYLNSGVVDFQLRLPKSLMAKLATPMQSKSDLASPNSPHALSGNDLITNSIGMKLKLIPAGQFQMGSPLSEQDRSDYEGPQRKVLL